MSENNDRFRCTNCGSSFEFEDEALYHAIVNGNPINPESVIERNRPTAGQQKGAR